MSAREPEAEEVSEVTARRSTAEVGATEATVGLSGAAARVGNRQLGVLLGDGGALDAELARRVGNRALARLVAERKLARSPSPFGDWDSPSASGEGDAFGADWPRRRLPLSGSTEQLHAAIYGNPALAHAPMGPMVPRTEVTAFGTWRVVEDTFMGPLTADQITQSDFVRLKTAWTRVNDGSGGLKTNGSAADKTALFAMFGREIARSRTFRDVIVDITEDATHPVTINVGRNNAYWVDAFATNNVDLDDLEWFEAGPVLGYNWVQTQGEIILHWLVERRFAAVHGGGFAAAHAFPLAAGGPQEQYRRELGQAGRVVSQTKNDLGGGLEEGRYKDTTGNMVLIRRDASAGDPVVYEMEYRPAAPTVAAPGRTRINEMVAEVQAPAAGAPAGQLYVRFVGATRAASAPPQAVAAGGTASFRLPLGQIVPVGGPITVEVWRRPPAGADVRLGTMAWAHPFSPTTAPAAGARPTVNVRLERR